MVTSEVMTTRMAMGMRWLNYRTARKGLAIEVGEGQYVRSNSCYMCVCLCPGAGA